MLRVTQLDMDSAAPSADADTEAQKRQELSVVTQLVGGQAGTCAWVLKCPSSYYFHCSLRVPVPGAAPLQLQEASGKSQGWH